MEFAFPGPVQATPSLDPRGGPVPVLPPPPDPWQTGGAPTGSRPATTMRALFLLLAVPALGPAVLAQVPVGSGVRLSFDSTFYTAFFGADLVDLDTGQSTQVSGLSAAGSNVNGGTLDPITGDLILGGIDASDGELRRVRLAGSAVASETVLASTGGGGLSAVDVDANGDYFTCDLARIYRVGRHSGAVTVWDATVYDGLFNGLCIDVETNTMWVVTFGDVGQKSVLIEYDLSAGPGPGTVLAGFGGGTGLPSGLTGVDDDGSGNLYLSTFGYDPVGSTVLRYDGGLGTVSQVPMPLTTPMNDVRYDRRNGDLHLTSGIFPEWLTLDPGTGILDQVTSSSSVEIATNLALNDFLDRTDVFPRRPSVSQPFLFEAAMHGEAAQVAAIFVTGVDGSPIQPILLGSGVTDSGGFFSLSIPIAAASLPAGVSYAFTGIRIDGGAVVLGSEVELTTQP